MQATTVKLHSLGYEQAKTYWIAALFVAGNVLLPQLCHLVPQGGVRWLPIYFFTLIAAYKYGWRAGMPDGRCLAFDQFGAVRHARRRYFAPYSVQIVAAGRRRGTDCCALPSRVAAAACGCGARLSGDRTLGEWAMTGSLRAALQDFRIGLPGMSLQILGGWAFMRWVLRR